MKYVFVPGAWHGGWYWYKLVDQLQKRGHQVETPDLPGGGADLTPLNEITLDSYIRRIEQVLSSSEEPVILVSHSLGGLTATGAAEACPDRVQKLVYIAASLVASGESFLMLSARLLGSTQAFPSFLEIDVQQQLCRVRDDLSSLKAFYAGCSDADIEYARPRLVSQPMSVYTLPLVTTQERYGKIPRAYITCLSDTVISYDLQEKMYTSLPCQVFRLNTGHFPMFSMPEELTEILTSLAL